MAEGLGETNRVLAEILSEIKALNRSLRSHSERINDLEISLTPKDEVEEPSPLDESESERTHREPPKPEVVHIYFMSSSPPYLF